MLLERGVLGRFSHTSCTLPPTSLDTEPKLDYFKELEVTRIINAGVTMTFLSGFLMLLDAGYNYLSKQSVRELVNFIYYKISKVVSILLMPVRTRWKIQDTQQNHVPGQLEPGFN